MRAKKIQNQYIQYVLSGLLLLAPLLSAFANNETLLSEAHKQQQKLIDTYGLLENIQWSESCDRLVAELLLTSFKQCLIIDAPFPNAYSLAHGVVILTRGLLKNIHNDDQLAHILAHEHAHITLNHHQEAMQMVNNPPKFFTKSRIKKFYRQIEQAADDEADKLLLQHQLDPKQIHHYLIRITKQLKESSDDHEKLSHRIQIEGIPSEKLEGKWLSNPK